MCSCLTMPGIKLSAQHFSVTLEFRGYFVHAVTVREALLRQFQFQCFRSSAQNPRNPWATLYSGSAWLFLAEDLGLSAWDLCFSVQDLSFSAEASGFSTWDLGFRAKELVFRMSFACRGNKA